MATFDTFKNEWLGKKVDYDKVYQFQCVDLIRQYVYECYGLNAGVSGNAIDYWNNPTPTLLSKFYKIQDNNVQKGDIAVFHGLPGNPYGHIGIATGISNATQLEILEQNGFTGNGSGTGNDAIRLRYIERSRLAGLLRAKTVAPAPAPHTPVNIGRVLHLPASETSWRVYHVAGPYTSNPDRSIAKLNPQQYSPMSYDIISNPAQDIYIIKTQMFGEVAIWGGAPATITDKPAPPAPAPYVPPAAPLPVPKAPQYTLLTTVMAFKNANDAANHNNAQRSIPAGTYYVYNDPKADKNYGMYNLTKNASKPGDLENGKGGWINPRDNVEPKPKPPVVVTPEVPEAVPVVVAPAVITPALPAIEVPNITTSPASPNLWKTTNTAVRLDRQPEIFYRRDENDITVYDLDGTRPPITLHTYTVKDGMRELTPIPIVSTFWKDGIEYGRTPKAAKEGWWYGVPISALDYNSMTTIAERVKYGTAGIADKFYALVGDFERLIQDVKTRKAKK